MLFINGAFPQTFVWRNDISGKNDGLRYLSPSFFPLSSGNIISSHKSLWKCHSHNKVFFNAEISIYSRAGFFIYFMQMPAFYLFCRKSSNIFEKNLRTRGFIRNSLYKIFEQINEKFRAGINGYFCIKKSSILMGMYISSFKYIFIVFFEKIRY